MVEVVPHPGAKGRPYREEMNGMIGGKGMGPVLEVSRLDWWRGFAQDG